jgi:hypothetical protein
VEKPEDADRHDIYIYYPHQAEFSTAFPFVKKEGPFSKPTQQVF